jgi:hypothetical protein
MMNNALHDQQLHIKWPEDNLKRIFSEVETAL